MKTKTSITLSEDLLKAIDLYIGEYKSRSEFLETAARRFIAQLARKKAEERDLEIINRLSDSLNAEAEVSSMYALSYLSEISKAISSDRLTLQMAANRPIVIEFTIAERGEIHFLLAPRIERR